MNKNFIIIIICVGVLVLAGIGYVVWSNSVVVPPPPPPPVSTITNPDYLKNPSAYLIDNENKVFSSPKGKTLWVEEVVDSHTLKVSYIIDKAGEKIIKIEVLPIPWLTDPAEDRIITGGMVGFMWETTTAGQCWRKGAKEFLQNHFFHSEVFFNATGWNHNGVFGDDYLLAYSDGTTGSHGEGLLYLDLASYVIKNGFGGFELPKNSSKSSGSGDYFFELKDMEEVASLAKRGLWGTCQ